MTPFITSDEFKAMRDIGKKIDVDKANESLRLAMLDIRKVMGDRLFFEVLNNVATSTDILEAADFDYNGYSYSHDGLKAVLGDYAYARYIEAINVNIAPFGAVSKQYQDGRTIDRNMIRDIVKQAQIDAGLKYDMVQKFIEITPKYSKFCTSNNGDGQPFGNTKFWTL